MTALIFKPNSNFAYLTTRCCSTPHTSLFVMRSYECIVMQSYSSHIALSTSESTKSRTTNYKLLRVHCAMSSHVDATFVLFEIQFAIGHHNAPHLTRGTSWTTQGGRTLSGPGPWDHRERICVKWTMEGLRFVLRRRPLRRGVVELVGLVFRLQVCSCLNIQCSIY